MPDMAPRPIDMMIRGFMTVLVLVVACHAQTRSSNDGHIKPVPLQDVTLKPNSRFDRAVSLNQDYILGINEDSLLKSFRLNAGLDAPGKALGGWEDPKVEVRGQFMGHWLSGTAMLGRNTGNKAVLDKAETMIKELRKVQQALGGEYLSAFPTEHFDRLRSLQAVWAPFYVIHKIMAGLLDHYNFLGNQIARQMVVDMAKYFQRYIQSIIDEEGEEHWTQMLEIEYGGMEEVLFNLYDATGNQQWQIMAKYFTKPNFFEPLTQNTDTLPGRHANTHLAQVNGFAAGFSTTKDWRRSLATSNFFDIVTGAHSYATGGNNDGEYWQAPYQLGATIAGEGAGRNTEETCTTYNMMKIARYLFQWTGNARYADYYERAILNGMLGVQRMPANYTSHNADSAIDINVSRRQLSQTLWDANFSRPDVSPNEFGKAIHSNSPKHKHQAMNSIEAYRASIDWRREAYALVDDKQILPEGSNAPGPGVIIYLMPLGAGNSKDDSWHHWSTPLDSFWCCSGSIVESFGKVMDSIYFERRGEDQVPELYINQMTPSSLFWKAGGLHVLLDAAPFSPKNRLQATIGLEPIAEQPRNLQEAVIKLRVPMWAVAENSSITITHGNVTLTSAEDILPGAFVSLRRRFESGDKLVVEFGMKITTEKINDWHPEFNNLRAVIMGNYVMAALTDHDRDIQADPDAIADHIHEVSEESLRTLRTSNGLLLQELGGSVTSVEEKHCLDPLRCTFRILNQIRSATGVWTLSAAQTGQATEDIAIESMAHPGFFLSIGNQGRLIMKPSDVSSVQVWTLKRNSATWMSLSPLGSKDIVCSIGDKALAASAEFSQQNEAPHILRLILANPIGSYPEGAKLLKGTDKSYIIAPIGHIVEEKYSPYLHFLSGMH